MSNKLFQPVDLSHKPKRNGYDLGNRVNFTAKAGELLPIWHKTVMPGDSLRLRANHFTRTAPLDTAAAVEIKEYFDFFFVPYRILWKNAPQVHTWNEKNSISASSPVADQKIPTTVPQFNLVQSFYSNSSSTSVMVKLSKYRNQFGYNRAPLAAKLMNHLGYGYLSSAFIKNLMGAGGSWFDNYGQQMVCLYPLLAYQCIYYNFFRNTQWENNVPYNYNVDYMGLGSTATGSSGTTLTPGSFFSNSNYWSNMTMWDLRYANYPRDLIFGLMPSTQDGDPALVQGVITDDPDNPSLNPIVDSSLLDADTRSVFKVLDLRKAQFLQRYREIVGSGNQDYKTLVRKIFGIEVSDVLAGIPTYLGGRSSSIKISDIDNTNLSGDNQATQAGKGTGGSSSDLISFECKEPGVVMCIYHAMPVIDYSLSALHFDVTKTESDDYANPVFDQLGFQEFQSQYLDISGLFGAYNTPLGYTTRYFDYKTSMDMTLGDFRETQKSWLAPVDASYLSRFKVNDRVYINSNFFMINPCILDPVFALKASPGTMLSDKTGSAGSPADDGKNEANFVSTDQLRVFASIDCQAVRNLDYNGVPY